MEKIPDSKNDSRRTKGGEYELPREGDLHVAFRVRDVVEIRKLQQTMDSHFLEKNKRFTVPCHLSFYF